jgi:exodeoxyribonuclease VII small subunit
MSKGKGGKELSYGEAAARLEEILRKIEEGRVDIDELSGLVAEAASLVTLCRGKIHAAEVQVKTITEQLERDVAADDEPQVSPEPADGEDVRY